MSRVNVCALQELSYKAGERNKDAMCSLAITALLAMLAVVYVFEGNQDIPVPYVILPCGIVAIYDALWSLGVAAEYTRLWTEETRKLREGSRG